MRILVQGVAIVGLFVAANGVAAGVVLVLGLAVRAIAPSWYSPWPWLVIGVAGAGAAYFFLKGIMFFAAERAARGRRRLFVAATDPNKGLESASGQRGG